MFFCVISSPSPEWPEREHGEASLKGVNRNAIGDSYSAKDVMENQSNGVYFILSAKIG